MTPQALRWTAVPLCAAVFLSAAAGPSYALNVRKKILNDQESFLTLGQNAPTSYDTLNLQNEQMALASIDQQQFTQDFSSAQSFAAPGAASPLEFVKHDAQGNTVFSYWEDGSTGEKKVIEGDGTWSYLNGRLVSYESPTAGRVLYNADSSGNLTGITQEVGGVTHRYDASGRILSSDSAASHTDYVTTGVYRGYIDRLKDLASGQTYFYEYVTAVDGTVTGTRRASRPLDIASSSLSASSSRYISRSQSPSLDVQFTLDPAAARPEVILSASAYDPASVWAMFTATADPNRIRIYWTRYAFGSGTSQSDEQTIDYAFDRSQSYRLRLAWENDQAHLEVVSQTGTQRVYTLTAADWNPRFMATSTGIDFSIFQTNQPSSFTWQRNYQIRNLNALTPFASRVRIDPAAPSISLSQTWSDPTTQIVTWYDARLKQLQGYTRRYNAAQNSWSYEAHAPAALNLTAGLDYRFETVFADGRFKLFVWLDGTDKPAQAVRDIAGLASADGIEGTLFADGASLELLSTGSGPQAVTPERQADLGDFNRDWIYTARGLELYRSGADGTIRYQYDAQDHLSGITQDLNGTSYVYDRFGTALYSDSAAWHTVYKTSGVYQGYVDTETELSTGEEFVYSYTTASDGTVSAEKRSSRPLDVANLRLSASSNTYTSRLINPNLQIEFGFADAVTNRPEVTISAYGYEPLERWALFNVTAERNRIRVYSAGYNYTTSQSTNVEWSTDFTFDPSKRYQIRLGWQNNEAGADLFTEGVFTQRIYTLQDAAWNPRFFASSEGTLFDLSGSEVLSKYVWNRDIQLKDVPTAAPAVIGSRITLDPSRTNASFGQKWSDAASQITVRYDARMKRVDTYVYRFNAASGQWDYQTVAPIPLTLDPAKTYRTETRIENGRWKFFIWEDGAVKPASALLDLAGFVSTPSGKVAGEMFADGAVIDLASDTAIPAQALRRVLSAQSALYRYYPTLSTSAEWTASGQYLNFFDQSANALTGLPLSHIGNNEAIKITHAYDAALYILGGGQNSEQMMDYLMSQSAFAQNPDYVPAGGIYSDLSQTGEWQPGFDRWNVHAGPNAWIGEAALRLYLTTGRSEYLDFAVTRAAFLKGLQESDGGLVMGPRGQFGIFSDIRSTENNFSAMHFFENLARATQDPRYQTIADNIWNYLKTLYDPASHTFLRGERRSAGVWIRDSVDNFATDTVSWLPLERFLADPAFGATAADRLAEVERMITAAETFAVVKRPDGQTAGFSFSKSARDLGVISIEWSLQFTNFYLKVSRAFQQLGDDAGALRNAQKHDYLLNAISGYFRTVAAGQRVAPYAVYVTGQGAYNQPTGHDFSTPSCDNGCSDVYSLPSSYFKFAVNGADPLRPDMASILETDYL